MPRSAYYVVNWEGNTIIKRSGFGKNPEHLEPEI